MSEGLINAEVAQLIRASAFQAEGRGFESRFPLKVCFTSSSRSCCCSSVVEHFLGKEEVMGSTPINSSFFW